MATPKKLPSGSWRIQVFDHVDVDGKKHYKSFTAPTRREAQFMASEWAAGKAAQSPENLTLYGAVTRYIDAKRGVLSPSTVLGYEKMQRNYFKEIGTTKLKDLNNTSLQIWISDLSKDHSPKTVRNIHSLLASSLEMFSPDFRLKTTLPAKKKPELYCPSDNDVKKLLESIAGTELEIAVLLAAFGPLRRGEICALTAQDVHGNLIDINKSMVMGPDRLWYTRQPKTFSSYRTVEFPDFVINKLSGIEGHIIKSTPDQISNKFKKAVLRAGLPHFRFHDLRHYAASIMHAIGVPDLYILKRGGWASDNVMKTVYRNVIDMEADKQNKKILKHFKKVSHEISHEARKA
ncbi:site-specific integrase [Enterocloster lavalensis]|uniref:site-specific integrase n=1 Tax=Enterocloster lavalensis TaxID=460384 RepID=UPI002665780A|nr:site-specific integrase [Enterocloster lavalensis]